MNSPQVTVFICTRNRPTQLSRCLQSIVEQTHLPKEIIVVDNGSTDFVIPEMHYPCRTRFFSQPIPGLSYARNCIIPKAEGEVLAFLDDDAIAQQDWLSSAITHFRNSEIGCVTGKVLPFEVKNEWQAKQIATGWAPHSDVPATFHRKNFDALSTSPGTGTNIFVRKTFFDSNKFSELFGPGTPVYAADEHYLFHQLVSSGWQIQYEPRSVVFHDYVSTEQQFRNRILHCTISRGAFLTKFALSEKGYRMRTWKHVLLRLSPSKRSGSGLPGSIRTEGFLLGPIALLKSVFHARSEYRSGITKGSLLAEFDGH